MKKKTTTNKKAATKKKMSKKLGIFVAALLVGTTAFEASALTATDSRGGKALLKIVQAIKITKVRDLDFGSALQGETSTLPVAAAEGDGKSAKFYVKGIPSTLVSVSLDKTSVDVVKLDNAGQPVSSPTNDQKITIGSLAASASGNTDANGDFYVFVGGTRPAISGSQEAGNYSGDFTVTVSQASN